MHWVCHGVVRLVLPNGYILFPRCREVGFIQRSYIISTTVRSGLPNGSSSCIIIIIIMTPFDVEGRKVGVPRYMMGIWYGTSLVYGMVHRWYMIWYIIGIWYGTSLVYGMVVYGMVHCWYMVWYIIGIWYGGIWYGTSLVYGMVHHLYMVWYIVGFRVSYNHFNIYGYCIFMIIFTT